ncbi:hypothetical protein QVD17_14246 [Tagetes erecta]|uniref:C2H2-type domain-containing protein n=1 Tax=Tagetes erecta TaxID=13708 RepID=A0AAD8P2J4_TARER|nr:hypothetical protein QVD17_14243 [Tagetes erecta]KAK1431046.1 hypothetical protein QVD17_14246 [Tagetes erecta]
MIKKHHPEAYLDVHLGFINREGKLVCGLCQDNFVSIKYLYYHLRDDHSYGDMKMFFASTNASIVQVHSTEVVDQTKIYDQETLIEAAKVQMLFFKCYRSMAEKSMTHKEVNVNVVEDLHEPEKTLTLFGDHHQQSMGETSMNHKEVDHERLEEVANCLMILGQGHPSTGESSVHVEVLKVVNSVGSNMVHAFDLNVVPDLEEDDDHQ